MEILTVNNSGDSDFAHIQDAVNKELAEKLQP